MKSDAFTRLDALGNASPFGAKTPRARVNGYLRLQFISIFEPCDDGMIEIATRICVDDKDAGETWAGLEPDTGQVAVWVSLWSRRLKIKLGAGVSYDLDY